MAEIIESLPWWQEELKGHDDEEGDICHDCALDEVADSLTLLAHALLKDEGQSADRQHITESLLRAAQQSNWLPDEELADFEEAYAQHKANEAK
jgi:hypothetical protein